MRSLLFAGLVVLAPMCFAAERTKVDLSVLDREMVGPRSEVLVLGTVHLRELPKGFQASALDGLVQLLAAFKPDIITIEDEPGEDCDLAQRHPTKYGSDYCELPREAQAATGLDIPAALAEVNATLKAWPAQPLPEQRRRLAAAFLASMEPASALVQWLQLPDAERHGGNGLNATLVKALQAYAVRQNESSLISAPLAARLGLQRVYPTDNHTGDRHDVPDIKALVKDLEAAWKAGGADYEPLHKKVEELQIKSDLLPLYRYVNQPGFLQVSAATNVVPAMASTSPQRYPQMWVGGWEVRNLRMVANIRETFRERPGARVLSIVGATHKPWFDSFLGQLQGVSIVDVAAVLK